MYSSFSFDRTLMSRALTHSCFWWWANTNSAALWQCLNYQRYTQDSPEIHFFTKQIQHVERVVVPLTPPVVEYTDKLLSIRHFQFGLSLEGM